MSSRQRTGCPAKRKKLGGGAETSDVPVGTPPTIHQYQLMYLLASSGAPMETAALLLAVARAIDSGAAEICRGDALGLGGEHTAERRGRDQRD